MSNGHWERPWSTSVDAHDSAVRAIAKYYQD